MQADPQAQRQRQKEFGSSRSGHWRSLRSTLASTPRRPNICPLRSIGFMVSSSGRAAARLRPFVLLGTVRKSKTESRVFGGQCMGRASVEGREVREKRATGELGSPVIDR